MTYKLYIGANNKSKKLEKEKAIKVVSSFFTGFTITTGTGYWKLEPEKSMFIEIETPEKKKIIDLILELKEVLKQDSIGYSELNPIKFI